MLCCPIRLVSTGVVLPLRGVRPHGCGEKHGEQVAMAHQLMLGSCHSTGVLRRAGAEMTAPRRRTLKLIWVIPAERGGDVFRCTAVPLPDDRRLRRRHS